jgi:hypothetical protein
VRCARNYEKRRDEVSGEYICIPKECENRTAWKNKSCSLKEDFLLFDENSDFLESQCYYLKDMYDNDNENKNNNNNNGKFDINFDYDIFNDYDDNENYDTKGRCVRKEKCPLDYPGVCNYSLSY